LVGPLPVEALEVGDRVRALDESACVSAESRDLVRVAVLYATPEHEWDTTYVEVLVERTEADERGYAAGRTVHFEHAGLGIDTVVEVVSVEPADVAEGEGCLVVATITHQNGELVRLRVSGSDEEIVATRTHPIWSLSREEWIQAADLALGELVQTASGPAAVESLEALYQLRQVFNFEVEGAHEYLVGEAQLRAHNGGTCPVEIHFAVRRDVLSDAQQQQFTAHLAEQELALNWMSLERTDDLRSNLELFHSGSRVTRGVVRRANDRAREIGRQRLVGGLADPKLAQGLDAAHALDAVAGGYLHNIIGLRNGRAQQYIGTLWRARWTQIVPGRTHRLIPVWID
jgi:hypothetical protein